MEEIKLKLYYYIRNHSPLSYFYKENFYSNVFLYYESVINRFENPQEFKKYLADDIIRTEKRKYHCQEELNDLKQLFKILFQK